MHCAATLSRTKGIGFLHKICLISLLLVVVKFSSVNPAIADPISELDSCVQQNTDSEERNNLVRLMLLALLQHPAVSEDVKITPGSIEDSAKSFANYFEEILVIDCLPEARAAAAIGGGNAVSRPFILQTQQALNQLGNSSSSVFSEAEAHINMQEIMSIIGIK